MWRVSAARRRMRRGRRVGQDAGDGGAVAGEFGEGVVAPRVGVMWATRFIVGEKTSSGTMQPPRAASPRPRSSEIPAACCSLRNSVHSRIPAPAPTRANRITAAVTPMSCPQRTPNSSAEPRMITTAWMMAIRTRPRVSPAITVPGEVGVASMRRDRPSRRVSMRATAPVRAMRSRKSRSSVQAPSSNCPSLLENRAVPAVVWVTEMEGTAGEIRAASARPASKVGAERSATANRAAPSSAACCVTAPRTVSRVAGRTGRAAPCSAGPCRARRG